MQFLWDGNNHTEMETVWKDTENNEMNGIRGEHKLVYGVARVLDIAPAGEQYATGSYSLRLSDGDVGTLYGGTF